MKIQDLQTFVRLVEEAWQAKRREDEKWFYDLPSAERAVRLHPNNTNVHNNLGCALSQRGRFDEAVQSFQRAIELDLNDSVPHFNLGGVLYEIGKPAEAMKHYVIAGKCGMKEEAGRALAKIAVTSYEHGKEEESELAIRSFIELDPNIAVAHNCLGNSLSRQGRQDEAIKHYEIAAGLGDKDAEKKLAELKEGAK